jgi:hypothetical protein
MRRTLSDSKPSKPLHARLGEGFPTLPVFAGSVGVGIIGLCVRSKEFGKISGFSFNPLDSSCRYGIIEGTQWETGS